MDDLADVAAALPSTPTKVVTLTKGDRISINTNWRNYGKKMSAASAAIKALDPTFYTEQLYVLSKLCAIDL